MVNKSVLFDIVFNTVKRNIKETLYVIDEVLGEKCKNFKSCVSCECPHSGNDCKKSDEAYWKARGYVEKKQKDYEKIMPVSLKGRAADL